MEISRIVKYMTGRTRLCRAWVLCNCCPYWDSCSSILCRSFLNLKQLLLIASRWCSHSYMVHVDLQINRWNLLTNTISPCICTITVGTITVVCREDLSWCSLRLPENHGDTCKSPCSKDLYIIERLAKILRCKTVASTNSLLQRSVFFCLIQCSHAMK